MSLTPTLEQLRDAQHLADAGRFSDLAASLDQLPPDTLTGSPGLSVLAAIAAARSGDRDRGKTWAEHALREARRRGDAVVELRALNVCGAIAFESGLIDDAEKLFAEGVAAAHIQHDHATIGRCSNNLGNIHYMRGAFDRATSHYQLALPSFQRVGLHRGIGEVWHNLAAVHRERDEMGDAFDAAVRAVEAATAAGDENLLAQTVAGRAEVWLAAGDPAMARREAGRALVLHRSLEDTVRMDEDRRILACAEAALGRLSLATDVLRAVMERAQTQGRPYLVALAGRDLATVLRERGNLVDAKQAAHAARVIFERLAAAGEVRKIDTFLRTCSGLTENAVPELRSH